MLFLVVSGSYRQEVNFKLKIYVYNRKFAIGANYLYMAGGFRIAAQVIV